MSISYSLCTNDDDFAKVSVFLLDHKYDLHPSFDTMDMVSLIYSYVTEGFLIKVTNESEKVIAVGAYYHGTSDQEFKNKDVALIDVAILDRNYRGTRIFFNGLYFMVNHIMKKHPEVEELRLAALKENEYLCRLYSKFTNKTNSREGANGIEVIFSEKIRKISTSLKRYSKL